MCPSFVCLFVCPYVLLGLFARLLGIIVCLLKIRSKVFMDQRIVYIDIYKASEDATTLAFFNRLEALDAFAEKHLDLATKAAGRWPGTLS